MPTLPNLDPINDTAKWDRILAAFPGVTLAEKSVAYKAWLRDALINKVLASEQQQVMANANALIDPPV